MCSMMLSLISPLLEVSNSSNLAFSHPSFREQRQLLEKCAATALNSKLIAGQKDFFSNMVVDAVMALDELMSLKMIGIKKVQGGALEVCVFIVAVWVIQIWNFLRCCKYSRIPTW